MYVDSMENLPVIHYDPTNSKCLPEFERFDKLLKAYEGQQMQKGAGDIGRGHARKSSGFVVNPHDFLGFDLCDDAHNMGKL